MSDERVFEIDDLIAPDPVLEIVKPDLIEPGDAIRIVGLDENGDLILDGGWQDVE